MAMTVSPIIRSSDLPMVIDGNSVSVSIFSTARSDSGSVPTTLALNSCWLARVIAILDALTITW